jgi:hypothetical protein
MKNDKKNITMRQHRKQIKMRDNVISSLRERVAQYESMEESWRARVAELVSQLEIERELVGNLKQLNSIIIKCIPS